MLYTVSELARKFGLSRSSLLYYDSIGLFKARKRSRSNYRIYCEQDRDKLAEITQLRNAGIPLREIKKALAGRDSRRTEALRTRLKLLNGEIALLRQQQRLILDLLGQKELIDSTRVLTKEKWVSFLRQAGLDQRGMERWHIEFERSSPEAHQDFLESLGLEQKEIVHIRALSREGQG